MEIVNVVIDESLESGFEKFSKETPKFKKLLNKSLYLQVLQVLQVLQKIQQTYRLYLILNTMKRKDLPPGSN